MTCYINGILHTMTHETEYHTIMATEDGKIIAFDQDVMLSTCDRIIDLKGAHLYPGFIDNHLHIVGYGEYLNVINLSECKDLASIIHQLNSSNDELIFAIGYHDIGLTKHDLDLYFNHHMVVLRHSDFHSLTLNSKALAYFNVKDDLGILKEEKASSVMQKMPKPSYPKLKQMIEQAIDQLTSYGITGGHSDDLYYHNGFDLTYQAYHDVLSEKPFRAHLLIHHQVLDNYINSKTPWGVVTPYLEFGAVKMFYDGTMSSQTALMFYPYQGTNSCGEVVMGKDQFIETLKKTRSLGLTAAIHVIGDRGLDEVCDILKAYPPQQQQIDRIIHAPWGRLDTVEKMKHLPISVDIQPSFLASDLPHAFTLFSQPPELMFPWKTYLKEDIKIVGSSDAPVEHPNPLLGIKDAIYRRSRSNLAIYTPSEKLTPFEAIKSYTSDAHVQSQLQPRGYLKVGYLADFTVFDRDLMTLDEADFEKSHVVMTVINDQVVYHR